MRLIDADALKETTKAHDEKIAYVSFLWDVDAAPTIDAIPVEWLARNAMLNAGCLINQYQMVLCEWEKEQEAR